MLPLVKQYCAEIYESGNLLPKEKKYLGMLPADAYPEKYGKKMTL